MKRITLTATALGAFLFSQGAYTTNKLTLEEANQLQQMTPDQTKNFAELLEDKNGYDGIIKFIDQNGTDLKTVLEKVLSDLREFANRSTGSPFEDYSNTRLYPDINSILTPMKNKLTP